MRSAQPHNHADVDGIGLAISENVSPEARRLKSVKGRQAKSLNDLVCQLQQLWRNVKTQRFRSLEIDHPVAARGMSISQPNTSEAGAILVNTPTLERRNLLPRLAIAISSTAGIYAFLFSGLSRREVARSKIGIASAKPPRTQGR